MLHDDREITLEAVMWERGRMRAEVRVVCILVSVLH